MGSLQRKALKVEVKGGLGAQLCGFYSSSRSHCRVRFDGEFFTFRLSHSLFLNSINLLLQSFLSKNLFPGSLDEKYLNNKLTTSC